MSLRVLFAAGDVGGARALRPVMESAVARDWDVHVLWRGHLATTPEIRGATLQRLGETVDEPGLLALLAAVEPHVVAFATSVADATALRLAALAQQRGTSTAHLLDNWTSYARRLRLGGLAVRPDIYAVMDEAARDSAAAEGIEPSTLRITGAPALSGLAPLAPPPTSSPLRLVFVSEPVSIDQGTGPADPRYRGYVETDAFAAVTGALAGQPVRLDVLPHPRESREALARSTAALRNAIPGELVADADRQRVLEQSHGIIGMASILLYEMWLRGRPVASVQPNLRLEELCMLKSKPGIAFATEAATTAAQLRGWAESIPGYTPPPEATAERGRHANAAASFLDAIAALQPQKDRR